MAIESKLEAPRAKLTKNDDENEGEFYYQGKGKYKRKDFEEEEGEEDDDELDEIEEADEDGNKEGEVLKEEADLPPLDTERTSNILEKTVGEVNSGEGIQQELLIMPQSGPVARSDESGTRQASGQTVDELPSKSDAPVPVQATPMQENTNLTIYSASHEVSVKQVVSSTVPSIDDDKKEDDKKRDVRPKGFRRILSHLVCGCQH